MGTKDVALHKGRLLRTCFQVDVSTARQFIQLSGVAVDISLFRLPHYSNNAIAALKPSRPPHSRDLERFLSGRV